MATIDDIKADVEDIKKVLDEIKQLIGAGGASGVTPIIPPSGTYFRVNREQIHPRLVDEIGIGGDEDLLLIRLPKPAR